MGLPTEPQTLSPQQIQELNQKLSHLRHNINNNLSLVIAGVEVIRRKPELTQRMTDAMAEQPQKIIEEIRKFSEEFEKALGITREKPKSAEPPPAG